jgi:hypothetical protein
MEIHLSRGIYGCAVFRGLYLGIRDSLLASPLSDEAKILKSGEEDHGSVEFAQRIAMDLGIKKTIVLIKGNRFWSYGCHSFSPKIGVEVILGNLQKNPLMSQIWIAHHIAHIKSNDILTWSLIPVILSIFTTVLLNSRSPCAAPLAGLAMMVISYLIVYRWREIQAYKVAFEKCSSEANQAAERHYEAKTRERSSENLLNRCKNTLFQLFRPSPETLLHYCRARLALTSQHILRESRKSEDVK